MPCPLPDAVIVSDSVVRGSNLDLDLTDTQVIDDRLVLLDYRVAGRPGDQG